jgi:glycosyltransferase involved in cell wall biosynthesis
MGLGTDSMATLRPSPRRRLLNVGNATYDLPLAPGLARKWDAVAERLELRVVGRAGTVERDDPRFRLVRSGRWPAGAFQLSLTWVVASEVRRFKPDVIVAQSPYEALPILLVRPLLRGNPKLVVEVHGDWRLATRLYGSRWRRPFAAVADRLAVLALRRADDMRAVGPAAAALVEKAVGRAPSSIFATYSDLESFVAEPTKPLPQRPTMAWIGSLQPVKDPQTFADAWRTVAERLPDARAVIVGDGPLRPVVDALCEEFPERVRAIGRLSPPEVAELLDDSTVLALPSRSEGLPRVIMEAFARARPVVGADVGGIPDLVVPEKNGLLVGAGDSAALAAALERVLGDCSFAERLSEGALEDGRRFHLTLDEYADAVYDMVERAIGARP